MNNNNNNNKSDKVLVLLPSDFEAYFDDKQFGFRFFNYKRLYYRLKGRYLVIYNHHDALDIYDIITLYHYNINISVENDINCLILTPLQQYGYTNQIILKEVNNGDCEQLYNLLMRKQQKYNSSINYKLSLDDFEMIDNVADGSYGTVKIVRKNDNMNLLAMKFIPKNKLPDIKKEKNESTSEYIKRIDYKNYKNMSWTIGERVILGEISQYIKHPYLTNLRYAFEDSTHWYFVFDYVQGGDLFDLSRKQKKFDEKLVKVWAAQLVSAIELLHNNDIIHRDIKLENILLDLNGNICLTDFGFATKLKRNEFAEKFCGTKFYLSPEMVPSNKIRMYNHAVDYWALGVLLFELISGRPPFYSKSKSILYRKIRTQQVPLIDNVSPECQDFINKLLIKNPAERLGKLCGEAGVSAVRNHPWFNDINWNEIENCTVNIPLSTLSPKAQLKSKLKNVNNNGEMRNASMSSSSFLSKIIDEDPNRPDANSITSQLRAIPTFVGFSYNSDLEGEKIIEGHQI